MPSSQPLEEFPWPFYLVVKFLAPVSLSRCKCQQGGGSDPKRSSSLSLPANSKQNKKIPIFVSMTASRSQSEAGSSWGLSEGPWHSDAAWWGGEAEGGHRKQGRNGTLCSYSKRTMSVWRAPSLDWRHVLQATIASLLWVLVRRNPLQKAQGRVSHSAGKGSRFSVPLLPFHQTGLKSVHRQTLDSVLRSVRIFMG